MDSSPERRVDQARERFQLQDYYGAIHLLEEIASVGHAYADAEHMNCQKPQKNCQKTPLKKTSPQRSTL